MKQEVLKAEVELKQARVEALKYTERMEQMLAEAQAMFRRYSGEEDGTVV